MEGMREREQEQSERIHYDVNKHRSMDDDILYLGYIDTSESLIVISAGTPNGHASALDLKS